MKRLPYLVILLFLGIVSCATLPKQPYGQLSQKLKIGMSKEEVKSILGEPKLTSMQKFGNEYIETWCYYSQTNYGFITFDDPLLAPPAYRLNVAFKNDKLFYWGDPADFSLKMTQILKNMQLPEIRIHQTIEKK